MTLGEMDVDAVIARKPQIAIVDELAHTNAPGSKNKKRYEDVLEILDAGIAVITAVNVQHIESLNDTIARITGVRVREAIPDYFLRRADEVVNVDVSVDMLRTRLRQGKIYKVEKIEQALTNFFRRAALLYPAERAKYQHPDAFRVSRQTRQPRARPPPERSSKHGTGGTAPSRR